MIRMFLISLKSIVIATHDEAFAETASHMLKLVDGSVTTSV
ncbi:MAG: hypothetical protein Q7J67_01155 [bacterium]|nr:hypothetical protein [bacterium]